MVATMLVFATMEAHVGHTYGTQALQERLKRVQECTQGDPHRGPREAQNRPERVQERLKRGQAVRMSKGCQGGTKKHRGTMRAQINHKTYFSKKCIPSFDPKCSRAGMLTAIFRNASVAGALIKSNLTDTKETWPNREGSMNIVFQ